MKGKGCKLSAIQASASHKCKGMILVTGITPQHSVFFLIKQQQQRVYNVFFLSLQFFAYRFKPVSALSDRATHYTKIELD